MNPKPFRILCGARCAAALIATGLALLVAGPATAKPLKIGTVAWAGFSPLSVADAKGFWKEQGLEVEVTIFGSNQEVNGALEAGRLDLALDMIGSWVGLYQTGVPLVIVGETDWSNGGDKIIAKKGYDFTKIKGQRVGVYLDQPSVTYFLARFLKEHQLTLADVDAVELEPQAMSDNFIAGRLSLIVNYDPQAQRAEKEGAGIVAATSATYPGVIPEGFAALAANWASIPAADKARLWQGWLKAVAWAKEPANWTEYQHILNERTFPSDPDFSTADLRSMVDAVSIHSPATLAERNRAGGALSVYLEQLRSFLQGRARLTKDYTPAQLVATDSLVSTCSDK
jgi:NitT/TauT family transport system substrate-binding protein